MPAAEGTGDSRGGGSLKKSTEAWRQLLNRALSPTLPRRSLRIQVLLREATVATCCSASTPSQAEKSPDSIDSLPGTSALPRCGRGCHLLQGACHLPRLQWDLQYSWAGFFMGKKEYQIIYSYQFLKKTPILTVQNACIKSK